jgi:hypothetical protein
MLRIRGLGLPKGCAVIPRDPRKSREGRQYRDFGSVTAFRPFGEWEFCGSSHAQDWLPVIASEAKQSIAPQAQAEEDWIASSLRSSP